MSEIEKRKLSSRGVVWSTTLIFLTLILLTGLMIVSMRLIFASITT